MTITDNSDKVLSELEKKIARGLDAVGEVAIGKAKRICPVGSEETTGIKGYMGGTLRNSIAYEVGEDVMHIGTNVEYGIYVECDDTKRHREGTKAHFLRDSLSDHRKDYKQILEAALNS